MLQLLKTFVFAFFTLIACIIVSPQGAGAGQTTLGWNTSPSTGVIGYKLYFGTSSGNYSQNIDVGNVTNYIVGNLVDGQTYYFAATAYDSSGNQSGYSNEVYKTISSTTSTTYTITATANSNGTITALNNTNVTTSSSGASVITTVTVASGASQSFSIAPNSGYSVSGVTVDGVSVGAVTSYTFNNVAANHTITASFSATAVNTYTLTSSAGTGGAISPSGTITASSGASETYSITPNSGYSIASVTVDGASVGTVSTYSFSNINSNHSISAAFAANAATYSITASAGGGGSISPSGTVSVTGGSSQTFTITPNKRFIISQVLVDGTSVGAVSSYTFRNIAGNHTIQASFQHK